MERRGFFGSLVLTMFSLPKIVERITAGNPNNAAPPEVHIPTTWTANNMNTNTTLTVFPGTAGAVWNGTINTTWSYR